MLHLETQSHGARVEPVLLAPLVHIGKRTPTQAGNTIGSQSHKRWGFGLEFSELRNYVAGDEMRHINWRASNRAQKLMTKVYIEDRDARCLLVVDLMAHMYYGCQTRLCSVHAVYTAAMLAGLLLERSYQVAIAWITHRRLHATQPSHNHHKVVRAMHYMAQSHNAELALQSTDGEHDVSRHIHKRLVAPYAQAWIITSPYASCHQLPSLNRLNIYDPLLHQQSSAFSVFSNRQQHIAPTQLLAPELGAYAIANNDSLQHTAGVLRGYVARKAH